ncbi:MAG TPA: transcription initiation factor IIB [Candidatus Nitrosotalea sp.]|nr:transcription initiation factor IIB [Candidatus Nitrosotalea sp.]
MQEPQEKECPSTGGSHGPLVTDSVRGEILCARCGSVLADRVEDLGPEQRSFTMEEFSQNSRTGLASTLSIHDRGLSTVIGSADRDASGNSISSYMKYAFNRLRTWDSRSKANSTDRNLRSAFVIMESVQSKLDVSESVVERAAYIYRKALSKKIIRGRTISGMILSALYVACRESNVPRTLQDVANAGNVSFKDLSRNYRVLVKSLDLQVGSFNPLEFVSKIGTAVGLSEKAKREALDILNKAHDKGITDGKNPVSLAATAVFLSALINKERATQKSIAKASGVSSVTIRNQSRMLRKQLGMED